MDAPQFDTGFKVFTGMVYGAFFSTGLFVALYLVYEWITR
jgi:hypothetical protein